MAARSIAFLDESGDESGKKQRGASPLFVVGLAVFTDVDEAARCYARIDALRGELGKPARYEFHFRTNSDATRRAMLAAVAPFAFTYHAFVYDKPDSATARMPLYIEACAHVCALAGEELTEALLVVDAGQKDKAVRRTLAADIRRHVNDCAGRSMLREVRTRDSARDNLVQLADYVTGVARWRAENRPGAADYRALLARREGGYRRERA